MRKQRGATQEEDEALGLYQEGVIKSVSLYGDGGGWSVDTEDGWGCGVRNIGVEPKAGDTIRTYGALGYRFHGQDLNGFPLWYLTPAQEEAEHQADVERREREKRERFERDRSRFDAAYAALPKTFQERIDKFRRTNPDWRWEFEPYEMMCCQDALKIAAYCSVNRIATEYDGTEPTAAENVLAFTRLPYEQQKKAGIDEGHSGNSFGFACRLAYLWVTDPGVVVQEHGALTPLVGCEAYGCPHEDGG